MEINKLIIVFKTHLDIGFTDFSAEVIRGYNENFIPGAMKTAAELRQKGGEARFKWTTGSWLIAEYLQNASPEKAEALCEAVRNGDICWHGLPFTTHTEFMSEALFCRGLNISRRLDDRFGKKTIAAKMTDVPGHTKAMIPLLKKAGIELLHIGVNEASAVPDVPEIFRWRADSGEEIAVIYNGGYGNCTPLGDTGAALYFAHTYDNMGGQSTEEVEKLFARLRKEFPHAELIAGDLNDAALALRPGVAKLPVVTQEIGDSWIHGVGTDPKKVMQFRALERIYETLPEGRDKEILGDGLLMIPEHTWGLDEKTHLHENSNYARPAFEARKSAPNYKKMEASWAEQRAFLYEAVAKLSPEVKAECEKVMAEYRRDAVCTKDYAPLPAGEVRTFGDFTIAFNEQGAISLLQYKGKTLANAEHPLFTLLYEQFCFDDYVRFHKQYHRIEDDWAWQDFTKPGMEKDVSAHNRFTATGVAFAKEQGAAVQYDFCKIAKEQMGAPAKADVTYTFADNRIFVDFAWHGKPENRIAEALWLGFAPLCTGKRVGKLGKEVDVLNTVSRGNRNLCATDFGVIYNELTVECVDSALVSPGAPHLVDYVNQSPADGDPVFFNLYNNTWGTNFPMWYGEDARFRFVITVK